MYRKKELEWTIALLIIVILAIVGYSFYFASSIFYVEIILIVLAILSVFVLPDMLLTWLLIFSVVLATLFLVAGVVYIPANQRFLLLITFPVVLRIAKQVNIHRRTYLSIVKDYSEQAKELYESHLQAVRDGREESFQALLVHWAHNDYFQQIYPKEFRWMLVRLYATLKKCMQETGTVYYLSNGNFLILSSGEGQSLVELFQHSMLAKLLLLRFKTSKSVQEVQYKSGYLLIDSENYEKFSDVDDFMKNLERQLETDIIVEY
ncbi:hypothetical protein RG565_07015 [Streptococcus sp. IsoGale021]|uniref:hypothetical protein n=1 Tax=Streptococcus TaxID=1301 RepID=UPI001C8BF417|nr:MULTISPECIES: hypothetical protein [Streptococcus]MBX9101702.1 hypothetical protein [Streptococcus anginosus]MCY7210714.1 hypothetical protein [Streptococcus anginosus]MCY7211840.1 hypothetical protein [Streptococcus anginosus]MCY7227170.1 hypothetical protein [Streptococcus anginosus]MDQ8695072.1 hypothetical protein [Streptococcus sp. IsoGale021]